MVVGRFKPQRFAVALLALTVAFAAPAIARAQTKEAQEELKGQLLQLRDAKVWLEAVQGQDELAKLQAELAKLQMEVQRRTAAIKELEARRAAPNPAPKPGQPWIINLTDGNEKPAEIVLRKVGDRWEVVQPGQKKPEVKVWGNLKETEKPAQPQIKKPEGTRVNPQETGKPGGLIFRIEGGEGGLRLTPSELEKGKPGSAQSSVESQRLDKVEKQLQQIMKELSELHNELKQSQKEPPAL